MKHWYTGNYKTLLTKFKRDINKWKDMCSWTGRLTIVKRSILSKAIYTFNAIPIKIPMFLADIERSILKLIWNSQGTPNSQNDLENKKS